MARALSDDLRVRVLEAGAAGGSARSVAGRFGIGISTAIRWLRREHETGERAARFTLRTLSGWGSSWPLENHDFHRGLAPHGHDCTLRA